MKYAFFLILAFAILSGSSCKKILKKPLPVLHDFGNVYEGDFTHPLAGVEISSFICERSSTQNCDVNDLFVTDAGGSFMYPEKTNVFKLEKEGYKTVQFDLRNTLPTGVIRGSNGIEVKMER
jgi:hypothetical protein